MKRLILCLCLLAAPLAGPAGAAPSKNRSVASAPSKAKRKAVRARKAPAPKPETVAAPARTVAAPRRLEDIHIEGEIPAPQVLFVTARDQRRLTKFHHRRYLKSSVQVGETTVLPNRVALTSAPSSPAGAP
ncbi:MAG: hypothetical protein ACRENJ_06965 [Candidatus Eiseniibacteriota bacterium]